jgi:hypothetical protein
MAEIHTTPGSQCYHQFLLDSVTHVSCVVCSVTMQPGVWAVMERFGQVNGFLELNGPDIHHLENVMTMTPDVHASFDALEIWLEARVSA